MSKLLLTIEWNKFGEIYTETTLEMGCSKCFKTENQSYLLTGSGTSIWKQHS